MNHSKIHTEFLSAEIVYEIKKNVVDEISFLEDEEIDEDDLIYEILMKIHGLNNGDMIEEIGDLPESMTDNEYEEFSIIAPTILQEYLRRRRRLMRENKKKLIDTIVKLKKNNLKKKKKIILETGEWGNKLKYQLVNEIFKTELTFG
jgi:hypothetical protein